MTTETVPALTLDQWRALPDGPDFRRTATTYRDGWNGSTSTRTATYAGACVHCGTRTYTDTGGNDPRGPLGDHAAAPLDPTEYGATGATVPACFFCQNDTELRYTHTLRAAERAGDWRYTEPADPVDDCYQCGAPIRLRGVDGGQYQGWQHIGAPTFSRDNPGSAPYPYREHDGRPRRSARLDCRNRLHHFSGSWCERCGAWG